MWNDFAVDSLKTCNSDIGQNITRKAGPGLWKGINVPEGSVKTWFPFAEGFPFVVTISAGWDGFHVSVNGKHVTSFKYRQVPSIFTSVLLSLLSSYLV
jgi:hypothetical protein